MPYLRAALNPKRQSSERKDGSQKLIEVKDMNLVLALHQWMHEDDRKTKEELIRLGLA